MGAVVIAWAALAALQEPADVPTVALPPQAEVVEAAKPVAPAAEPARLVIAPPVETAAPRRIGDGNSIEAPSIGAFVVASVVVVALLGGGLWALRRFGKNSRFLGGRGPIRLLGRTAIGARQEILLVEVGPRVLVVGSTKEGLSSLGEISNPDEIAVLRADLPGRRDDSQRAAFQESLRQGLKAAPEPEPAKNVYASITDELAEIRKTVHAWKA